jgi:hypothetical protein
MWKDIVEFEGRYQISEDGCIRNTVSLNLLSPRLDKDGYMQIGIRKAGNRKKYWFKIHRLVAVAFVDNQCDELQVDHIDRNKLNNNYQNLRWVTCQENNDNRKDTCWSRNTTSGELHITKYNDRGYMLRINKHNLKHRSWHKTLEDAVNMRDSIKKE